MKLIHLAVLLTLLTLVLSLKVSHRASCDDSYKSAYLDMIFAQGTRKSITKAEYNYMLGWIISHPCFFDFYDVDTDKDSIITRADMQAYYLRKNQQQQSQSQQVQPGRAQSIRTQSKDRPGPVSSPSYIVKSRSYCGSGAYSCGQDCCTRVQKCIANQCRAIP